MLSPRMIVLLFVSLLVHESDQPWLQSWLGHVPWQVRVGIVALLMWDLWRWVRQLRVRTE